MTAERTTDPEQAQRIGADRPADGAAGPDGTHPSRGSAVGPDDADRTREPKSTASTDDADEPNDPVGPEDPDVFTVLLVADPGLPSRRANASRERLERQLGELVGRPVAVTVRSEEIRTSAGDEAVEFGTVARRADDDAADAVLALTEMPRHTGGRLVVAEIRDGIGVIFAPALGVLSSRRRVVAVLLQVISRTADLPRPSPDAAWVSDPATGRPQLRATLGVGGMRTVLGMTLTNEPWRAVRRLSSAVAAASATGAFGIFYNSIWQMSAALSTGRLLLIGVLAICAMTAWLIVGNRLWDRPAHDGVASVVLLYNLSTVLTLLWCMIALYIGLFCLILAGGLIVIDPDFMSEILDEDASFARYLDIAWLSAAMGVIAGGLGSGFDNETDLRRLTHGQRELGRRITEESAA